MDVYKLFLENINPFYVAIDNYLRTSGDVCLGSQIQMLLLPDR